MKEKLPSYLLEFPSNEFKTDLKLASTLSGKSMKDFILGTLEEKIDDILNKGVIKEIEDNWH